MQVSNDKYCWSAWNSKYRNGNFSCGRIHCNKLWQCRPIRLYPLICKNRRNSSTSGRCLKLSNWKWCSKPDCILKRSCGLHNWSYRELTWNRGRGICTPRIYRYHLLLNHIYNRGNQDALCQSNCICDKRRYRTVIS